MAASVTGKLDSNHDEVLVGLYGQQHILYLGSVNVDAEQKRDGPKTTM
jgi:hypothetical protein